MKMVLYILQCLIYLNTKKNFRDPFGHTINYYENNIKYLFNSNGFKIIEFKNILITSILPQK